MTPEKISKINETAPNALSIQVHLGGLSFCVHNAAENKITALEQHGFPGEQQPEAAARLLGEQLQHNEALQGPFKSVNLIHENELSTFVPASLFDDKNLSGYLKFNSKILENDFIAYDRLENHEMVNVYIPYVNFNNLIFDHFGAFEYFHFSTLLVTALLNKAPGTQELRMFVHVQSSHFEIVVIKQRKLLFYNTFSYSTKEDFIYYILFTAEQLRLDPDTFPLYLLGAIEKEDERYALLYTYIRNVFFGEYPIPFSFGGNAAPRAHDNIILLNSF